MGWLIALAIIVAIAICPVGVSAKYDEDGVLVRITAAFLGFPILPSKKTEKHKDNHKKKEKPKKKQRTKAGKKAVLANETPKKGGKITDFLPLVQVALDFLGEFRRKLRVKRLVLKVVLAGDDPCDLAVNYGRANAALGNLIPQLEKLFVIRKRDMQVECDFTADETLISARLDLNITVGRVLSLAVRYGYRALREYFKIKKKREGGAKK